MMPLEMASLPKNTDRIATYIDGRKLKLKNPPFVTEHMLFVPAIEMCGFWNYITKEYGDKIVLCADNNDHEITTSYIYDINNTRPKRLDYVVKQVGSVLYVDAAYFAGEHGITVAWEHGTNSAYFASVLHYDGYRIAPKEIFTAKKATNEYVGMFMFVDGKYYRRSDDNCKIVSQNGIIYLRDSKTESLSDGVEQRFCFRYEGVANDGMIPYGSIWEVCRINNEQKIGNMMYADESWEKITGKKRGNDLYSQKEKPDGGSIDKETFVMLFRQYPNILKDRKKLNSCLRDLFPHNLRDINLLMTAFDNHVFESIDKADELDDIFVHQMSKRLVNNNGIQMQFAIEAVCLCCEIYGTRIKGKEFVSKKKYNAEILRLVLNREEKWKDPTFGNYIRLGDLAFRDLIGWDDNKAHATEEKYYYYPYNDRRAMIYISRSKADGAEAYDDFNFESFVSGMTKKPEYVISMTDCTVDGIRGKKINHYLDVVDMVFEEDSYIVPYKGYIYGIMFGEEKALTTKMQLFEKRFLECFKIDENTEIPKKTENVVKKKDKSKNSDDLRLKTRAEMMDMIKKRYASIYAVCDSPTKADITGFDNLRDVLNRDMLEYVMFLGASSGTFSSEDYRFLKEFMNTKLLLRETREYISKNIDIDDFENKTPQALSIIIAMENLQHSAKKIVHDCKFFVDSWSPATELVLLYLQVGFAMSIERKDEKSPDMKRYMDYLKMLNDYLQEKLDIV